MRAGQREKEGAGIALSARSKQTDRRGHQEGAEPDVGGPQKLTHCGDPSKEQSSRVWAAFEERVGGTDPHVLK